MFGNCAVNMKIVILGGGLTSLTAAYYLSQTTTNQVVVLEKEDGLGGLARGFKKANWHWQLDKTYHHIFSNDSAILDLAKEIEFNTFSFSIPITSSLFGSINNYRIYPVDSPKDFLLLPVLSLFSKIRAGATLVFLKLTPHLSWFKKISSSDLLQKTMGIEVWEILWEQLFRKKYGKYAENILASFIWARINKRTQQLGYPTGGFQTFVDKLAERNRKNNVSIFTSTTVQSLQKKGDRYEIITIDSKGKQQIQEADNIISTLPYPVSCDVMGKILGDKYVLEQSKRKYLSAINLILKTKEPILKDAYWLNIGVKDIPIMCIVQHTNFINSQEYGGDEICYLAWYVEEESELLQKNEKEMLDFVLPYIRNIAPHLSEAPEVIGLFKFPYAQPIFDAEFVKISRSFITPAKNVYIANMDMTYPYDRGTNYAVKLGKDVGSLIVSKK